MATRRIETAETGSPWTRLEDEAAVSDYLDMLVEELSGWPVNKAEHNRRLRAVLTERSKGSEGPARVVFVRVGSASRRADAD